MQESDSNYKCVDTSSAIACRVYQVSGLNYTRCQIVVVGGKTVAVILTVA